ncbi:MAG TPA: hypothetical protein VJU83_01390 [Burkholderiales bacterium]|nr:hypothetical protein [Burkholderiales bacterium]
MPFLDFSPGKTRVLSFILLACGAAGALAYWIALGTPVEVRDAADNSVQCMSYAPYRRAEQTPHDPDFIVSPSQIEADLAILSRRTDCVRTYSVAKGQSEIPRIARKFGMKVIMGMWIGRDTLKNEQEITLGLEVLQRDSDAIRSVIVGNEVLLRGELTEAKLRQYIDRVREATSLPVSYAEVWEYWLRHPRVAESTSFVTIHILPYWEDDPAPIDRALAHVQWVYKKVQDAFPGREILIGETGWPSAGRNRHGAQPSAVNQARFIREFSLLALSERMQYNIIEAFDQPWKRLQEGTVGGYWGLYAADGEEKFSFFGPVAEEPMWMSGIFGAALGSAVLVGFAFYRTGAATRTALATLALGGIIVGAIAVAQWFAFQRGAHDSVEWWLLGLYTLFVPWLGIRLIQSVARWMDSGHISRPAPLSGFARWFNTNVRTYRSIERALGLLRFLFLVAAAIVCLLHVVDPRYRDFPVAMFLLPACGFALLGWIAVHSEHFADDVRAHADVEERVLALWLIPSAISISLREGWANPHAQIWALLCLLFAFAVLWPDRRLRQLRDTRQSKHA